MRVHGLLQNAPRTPSDEKRDAEYGIDALVEIAFITNTYQADDFLFLFIAKDTIMKYRSARDNRDAAR